MDTIKPVTDFSGVSYDEAVRRARELIPLLREEAPKCEELRRLSSAVMDALNRSGLIRYLQPKVRGGMELPFVAYFDIPEMLSRGDMSVGWVVTNLGSHHRNLAWWEPRAQEEVWGPDRDAGIASGIAYPQGRGVPADGGIVLSGEWGFSSGTDHSDWSMLACIVRDHDQIVDYMYCLLHRSQYEVVDDWHTLGMRATSSKTVRCKDVFVPAHRALSMYVARPGHMWPGTAVHRNPLYRIPISALGGHGIGGCMVGNARAALETAIAMVKSRSTNYTGARMRDFHGAVAHRRRRRADRRGGARPAQRLPGSAAHLRSGRHDRHGNAAPLQAQLRVCREVVQGRGQFPARDGGRQWHLRQRSAAAHVSRCTRCRRPFQLQHRCAIAAVGPRRAGWGIQKSDAVICV